MPDANKENTLNQLVGAAFGAAGQRCMALSTAILVGEARSWLPELVERAKALRVNAGAAPSHPTLHPFFPLSWAPCGLSVRFGQGHPHRPNHTFCPVVTTQRGLVEWAMLQICGQICGADLNTDLEDQILLKRRLISSKIEIDWLLWQGSV